MSEIIKIGRYTKARCYLESLISEWETKFNLDHAEVLYFLDAEVRLYDNLLKTSCSKGYDTYRNKEYKDE